ncbi:MAG: LPXTG cell wall anchor domain-containing protein [Anaerorhabdus sp.]
MDKSRLKAEISLMNTLSEEDYTEESWAAYTLEISKGKALLIKLNATQEEVDLSTQKIISARGALVAKKENEVDKSALDEVIDQIDSLNKENYTDESWDSFSKVVEQLKKEVSDSEITQEEVNQLIMELQNAIDSLVEKDTSVEIPNTDGGTTLWLMWIGLGALLLAVIAILIRTIVKNRI